MYDEEDECGYSYDHDLIEIGDGVYECKNCGAEIWDDEEDDNHFDYSA